MICRREEMPAEISDSLGRRRYRSFGNPGPICLRRNAEPTHQRNAVDVEPGRGMSKPVEVPELPRRRTRIDKRFDVEAVDGRVKVEFFFGLIAMS